MPWRLLARDAAILIGVASLFRAANAWHAEGAGLAATAVALTAGVLLGLASGYAAHEWGHLAGARAGGGVIQLRRALTSVQLFRFRTDENGRGPFLWMAWGGLVGLWLQAAALAELVGVTTPGGGAAVVFAVAGALFTTAVEGPTVWRVSRGGALPPAGGA